MAYPDVPPLVGDNMVETLPGQMSALVLRLITGSGFTVNATVGLEVAEGEQVPLTTTS